jgi:SAM-dependent methyltransferase
LKKVFTIMPINKFTKYYNYLLKNWNKSIANYIIKAEKLGEEKYGIDCIGIDTLRNLKKQGIDTGHSNLYMPVPYNILEHFFEAVQLTNFKHFLDIGCGKGRAMCVAAHYGVKKITGVDFSKQLINEAQNNVDIVQNKFPKAKFALVNNDAFYYKIPASVDCIFLFNPFDQVIMSGVVHNIIKSLKQKPRKLSIIYINPEYAQLFTAIGFKQSNVFKKHTYLEGMVLQNDDILNEQNK